MSQADGNTAAATPATPKRTDEPRTWEDAAYNAITDQKETTLGEAKIFKLLPDNFQPDKTLDEVGDNANDLTIAFKSMHGVLVHTPADPAILHCPKFNKKNPMTGEGSGQFIGLEGDGAMASVMTIRAAWKESNVKVPTMADLARATTPGEFKATAHADSEKLICTCLCPVPICIWDALRRLELDRCEEAGFKVIEQLKMLDTDAKWPADHSGDTFTSVLGCIAQWL